MKTTCFSLCLSLSVATAHAGIQIDSVQRNTKTDQTSSAQLFQTQDGKARIESGTTTAVMIFRDDALHVLDTQRKTFMVLDRATLERTSAALNGAMEKMRAQTAAMPPEQRAMMEKMLAQRGLSVPSLQPPVIDANATGGSEEFNGKKCKLWNVTSNGELAQQLCVVPFTSLPGALELRSLQKKMQALSEKVSGPMRQGLGNNALQLAPELLNKIDGYPVITRQYQNGVLSGDETIVKSWQTQKIDSARFDIPKDYTRQELPAPAMGR